MQEVVDVPGLVADPQVVRLVPDQVVEHHEVADQDLVHVPEGLEGVQVVLGSLVPKTLDVPGLTGQGGRGGVDKLASPLQQFGDRMLGQPVDLQARPERPQRIGDGQVAARVPEPDGRGDVEHPLRPVQRPGPGAPAGGRGLEGPESVRELLDRMVDNDGLPGLRQVPSALHAGELGDPLAALERLAAIPLPVHDQDRTAHLAQQRLGLLSGRRRNRSGVVQQHRLRADLHRPANAVFMLLGGMRLVEQLSEEELGVAPPVAQPVVPVALSPALLGVEHLVEGVLSAGRQGRGEERRPGGHGHHAEHPVGVLARGQQCTPGAGAQPHQDRTVDAGRVHDRDRVGHPLGVRVGLGRLRPVGPAVAARVDGDHLEEPGQVRHLRFPAPGVHDPVDGGEYHRGFARPEHLVADLDAVTFDEALRVGIPRPHSRLPLVIAVVSVLCRRLVMRVRLLRVCGPGSPRR